MPQWTKRILRRKGGKGTVTDAAEDSDIKAPRLMEFIEVSKESITAERCVNDLVLVDDALDDSMLDPRLLKNKQIDPDDQASEDNEIKTIKTPDAQGIAEDEHTDEKKKNKSDKTEVRIDETKKDNEDMNDDDQSREELIVNEHENSKTGEEEKVVETEPVHEVRRSQRKRNQRMQIQPDQIGACDDTKDIDYK